MQFVQTKLYVLKGRLYYWLTCVHEKVEESASSKLHLTIFHLSGHIAYARCWTIYPYLSGQIAHT